jgi:hypothetical protein
MRFQQQSTNLASRLYGFYVSGLGQHACFIGIAQMRLHA